MPPLLFHEVLAEELKHQLGTVIEQDLQGNDIEVLNANAEAKENFKRYLDRVEEAKVDLADVESELERANQINQAVLPALYKTIHTLEDPRTALCFSGGGIRSATFNLGILQSLAHWKTLDKFDYLSTVSGGGYIGSWLSAWIHRTTGGVTQVQKELGEPCEDKNLPEPEEVSHLRAYSRYMSPELGLLSADTWTLVAIYTRNLLLNWFVLVPLFAAFLLLPRILFTFTYSTAIDEVNDSLATIFLIVIELGFLIAVVHIVNKKLNPFLLLTTVLAAAGVALSYFFSNYTAAFSTTFLFLVGTLCGCAAVAYIIACRPSLSSVKLTRISKKGMTQGRVLLFGILLLVIWAYFSSNYWALYVHSVSIKRPLNYPIIDFPHPVVAFLAFGLGIHFLGFIVYRLLLNKNFNLTRTFVFELIVSILNGGLGGLLTWLVATNLFDQSIEDKTRAMLYACSAVPVLLLLFVFSLTLFVGLTSKFIEDMDREWLARFAGWLLIVSLVWVLLHVIVLYGPTGLSRFWQERGMIWKAILTAVGGTSALLTLLGGYFSQFFNKNSEDESDSKFLWVMNIAPKVAAPVFALFLLVLVAYATSLLLRLVSVELACGNSYVATLLTKHLSLEYNFTGIEITRSVFCKEPVYYHDPATIMRILINVYGWYLLAALTLLVAIGSVMGSFVNINKFSLHAAYRDRLIRAYLGASRKRTERKPNPFTGFDENDNIQMEKLTQTKPLHIINQTLNLVRGKNLAWQDRKAESFTASPLHCGSFLLGYRNSARYATNKVFDFLSSKKKKRAISLGTSMAISGAAASPNMGYYSSPIVTFLLAVFNVRLGWWLGNPGTAGNQTYQKAGPAFAARPLIEETLGLTDDENPYIYLSDGGHFENLGLYEMVRRRCHLIVASDASGDDGFAYDDLSNAVEKVRVDLGIPININFSNIPIYPPNAEDFSAEEARYCAIARISYSTVDGDDARDGLLIYIKPTLYGKEPIDIIHYWKENPTFPHQSTANQFFSEKQFESYRTLGFYIGHRVFTNEAKRKRSSDKDGVSDFKTNDFINAARLCEKLKKHKDPLSQYLHGKFTKTTTDLLAAYRNGNAPDKGLLEVLVDEFNSLLDDVSLFNSARFANKVLLEETDELLEKHLANPLTGKALRRLNRMLLEDAYSYETTSSFDIKKLIGLMKKLGTNNRAKLGILIGEARKQLGIFEI